MSVETFVGESSPCFLGPTSLDLHSGAGIVCLLYRQIIFAGIDISIPYEPMGTIGIAVAFYIGFKNNQSYDRNWEGRIIWGGIVNVSRSWANAVLTYVTPELEEAEITPETLRNIHRTLIYRQVAWITALTSSASHEMSLQLGSSRRDVTLSSCPKCETTRRSTQSVSIHEEADHVVEPVRTARRKFVRYQGDQSVNSAWISNY